MNVKKYFLALFTIYFCFINFASAYDGIILVLEAPLLREPDLSSQVVQTIRKGERVYIPREIVKNGVLPTFIPTFDRTGNRAYIPGRYVKIILGNDEERKIAIALESHDPTDYRLEEPIPKTYPFEDRSFLRFSASFLVGSNTNSPYEYNETFSKQKNNAEYGGRLILSKKINHDVYDRFYFGFIGFVSSVKNTINFKNESIAEESRGVIRGGPWLTYDAYKNQQMRLTFGTGFTYNYHRTTLQVNNVLGDSEERIFSGFSISPVLSTAFQVVDVIPNTDFITGIDVSFFLPYTLKTKDEPELPQLWGDNSPQISSGFKAQASLFVGVQVKY